MQDSRAQPIPDLSALISQRERIAIKGAQHLALSEQLRELKDSEENVTQSFEQAKSSLESVKDQIDNLRHKQESLIEKRERKKSSRHYGSSSKEDLRLERTWFN